METLHIQFQIKALPHLVKPAWGFPGDSAVPGVGLRQLSTLRPSRLWATVRSLLAELFCVCCPSVLSARLTVFPVVVAGMGA